MRKRLVDAAIESLVPIVEAVANDPRKLKPGQLCWLLNSTPLGRVITDRRLRSLREEAGLRIGDEKTIDLLRYAAWLAWRRHSGQSESQPPPAADGGPSYESKKERERKRNAALSRSGRDVGEIPQPVKPQRRARAEKDFRVFCRSYFPDRFTLPWSADHLTVIGRIEQAVLRGGLFAMAMPRGSGKTTLCEAACIWAALTGRRPFIALIGASAEHATDSLENIKSELESNELLAADWPEVCVPIAKLEGIANRARGQLYRGQRTHIEWGKRRIVLPVIAGSRASGVVIRVAGITGAIRGMKFTRPDGTSVRPSLVIVDDPQTDQSARSVSQCEKRERILAGAVLGLAGPGVKIAGIMPCTVVRPGDLADVMLDRDKHPEWQGERMKLVYSFPKNEKLWETYREIRAASLAGGGDGSAATEFYRDNRKAMDAGAKVAWPERHNEDEISAVQHAMNLKFYDEQAFWAEYQNEPLPELEANEDWYLSADKIAAKTSGVPRRRVPLWATHLTAFIDVQQTLLYWVVAAWSDQFTGAVVDYGTWPEQPVPYFTLREAPKRLPRAELGAGVQGSIFAGLTQLVEHLAGRSWNREDGAEQSIERIGVDTGYEADLVYQFCRNSANSSLLVPAKGRGVGPADKPMTEYQRKPGETIGLHWMLALVPKQSLRLLHLDTNFWKTHVHQRLATPAGDPGCLSLFGRKGQDHRLLSEHLTAEYPVKTEGKGRTVFQWKAKPNRDNHWFDCLVGAAVLASTQGVDLGLGPPINTGRKRRKITAADIARLRR